MFAHPQRLLRRSAAHSLVIHRVDCHEVRFFAFALVFEHTQERPPRRARSVPRVARQFDQAFRVQVLDGHEVVFSGIVVRQLVQEVTAFLFQVGVTLGYDTALFLPIRRAVLLAREVALRAFQAFTFARKVERSDRRTVSVVSALQDTHVDTDTPSGVLRFHEWVVRYLDTKDGVPLAGRLLFDGDGLYLSVVGKVAVENEGNLTKFREPQVSRQTCGAVSPPYSLLQSLLEERSLAPFLGKRTPDFRDVLLLSLHKIYQHSLYIGN